MKRRFRLTPHHHLINNPLFALDVRRVRWGSSARALLVYSGRRVAIICCGLLIVWLLVSLRDLQQRSFGDFPFILLIGSFLASLALDFTSMSSALGSINGEITSGRWDLLRLTLVTVPQIVAAMHGAAQVRAWRLMVLVVAVRAAVVLMLVVSYLIIELNSSLVYGSTPVQTWNDITAIFLLLSLGVLYILEPWWRMRTITALGVAISARARQATSGVLAAVAAIFAIWLLQGVIAFALTLAISVILLPLALVEYSAIQFVIISPLAIIGLITVTVYGFYSIVQTWSLRRAERWIASIN
ncbi:MAG: hypothetical protein ABI700_26015 [Chloroflexota bacterium]